MDMGWKLHRLRKKAKGFLPKSSWFREENLECVFQEGKNDISEEAKCNSNIYKGQVKESSNYQG